VRLFRQRGVGLTLRVTLIIWSGFVAGWLAMLALVYGDETVNDQIAMPSAAQVRTILDLVDQASPEDRPHLLAAIETPLRRIAILDQGDLQPSIRPLDQDLRARYAQALDGRLIAIDGLTYVDDRSALMRRMASRRNGLRFQLRLQNGSVLVLTTEAPVIVTRFGLPLGYGAAVLAGVTGLIGLVVLHRSLRPLRRLARAVDHMDVAGPPEPLPRIPTRAPEIRALVAAFERLQARIGTLIRARLALIGGVQHDVRSFATRLRLRIDRIPDDGERAKAAADIDAMIALLDDALLANRASVGEQDQELIDLAALMRDVIRDHHGLGRPVAWIGAPPEPDTELLVLGDRLGLTRILSNLLDNAMAYGGCAWVRLVADQGWLRITIDDEGPGIPEDQREMLLEPFARLETSRARSTGGAGLGLAIVSTLVRAHRGRLEITSAETGGARVVVRLPMFDPEDQASVPD